MFVVWLKASSCKSGPLGRTLEGQWLRKQALCGDTVLYTCTVALRDPPYRLLQADGLHDACNDLKVKQPYNCRNTEAALFAIGADAEVTAWRPQVIQRGLAAGQASIKTQIAVSAYVPMMSRIYHLGGCGLQGAALERT